ncbi:AAA family ATPase [Candidatus Marithrix sp. Canyon 246]|uniref:AAA family ATPase n=1 Tax=Candidatus Marithrix sp. Canyon 246 TaxID=1827136 RepID=UPI00084A2361|nr:AAA family ATPase [Candidatus Marithrix sp. Canyon 246]
MFTQITLENLAVFRKLEWQPHKSLNLIIGENDTGKTHLLKTLYVIARSIEQYNKRKGQFQSESWGDRLANKLLWTFQPTNWELNTLISQSESKLKVEANFFNENLYFTLGKENTTTISNFSELNCQFPEFNALFIPAKEILTTFDAIAATREQLEIAGFDDTYYDLIKALRLPMTKGQIQPDLQALALKLDKMIEGKILVDKQSFIFKRAHEQYGMSQTAEGIKKIGILSSLIRNRLLKQGTILFIDEPETNLHPKLIIALVDTLFIMASMGISIYLATHSYFVLRRFEWLARKHNESIGLCSLSRTDKNGVIPNIYNLQDGMPSNPIIDVSLELYEQNVLLDFE